MLSSAVVSSCPEAILGATHRRRQDWPKHQVLWQEGHIWQPRDDLVKKHPEDEWDNFRPLLCMYTAHPRHPPSSCSSGCLQSPWGGHGLEMKAG